MSSSARDHHREGRIQGNAAWSILCSVVLCERCGVCTELRKERLWWWNLTDFCSETLFEDFQESMHVSRAGGRFETMLSSTSENLFGCPLRRQMEPQLHLHGSHLAGWAPASFYVAMCHDHGANWTVEIEHTAEGCSPASLHTCLCPITRRALQFVSCCV